MENSVFVKEINDSFSCHVEEEEYSVPFSEKTKLQIVQIWGVYCRGNLVNGDCARLITIDYSDGRAELVLGRTDFFSFIISNVIRRHFSLFKEYAIQAVSEAERQRLITALDSYYRGIEEANCFDDALSSDLSNSLAVSILIKTKTGVMLSKRSSSVGVSPGYCSTSVTGIVSAEDLNDENPILSCATRELKEELGLVVSRECLTVKCLAMGKEKLQPVVLLECNLNDTIGSVKTNFEIESLKEFSYSNIFSILKQERFTEVAQYQLMESVKEHYLSQINITKLLSLILVIALIVLICYECWFN